ncbi:HNH endonuclease signature motif containing protein [Janibacter alittae]|uniref:DUF222 domain-containing protein n=1 Tax=Janibacter alittae TaxID=3115209 RepID=A0ABZ2MKP7_9MICO
MTATVTFGSELGVLSHLRDAARSLVGAGDAAGSIWQLGEAEVADGLATVGALRQLLDVAEVALVREGLERGLPAQESWSAQDWVCRAEAQRAPTPEGRHVAQVLRVAKGESRVAQVTQAFAVGDLPLGKADQLVRFEDHVSRVADPDEVAEAVAVVLEGTRDTVVPTGPDGRGPHQRVRGLTEREVSTALTRTGRLLRPDTDLEREDTKAKAGRALWRQEGPAGLTTYRVVLDAEGAAVVDGALAALSEPVTGPEGERDDRPPARRRADALLEVVRRGVSAPGDVPRSDKAQVHVTIPLGDLLGQGAHGAGVTMTGQVLAPSVVRRMACDAGIIPVVLGGDGEILDMGRSVRLFTPGQRRAVWLRDGGCTYPGCTMPPQWCDAHHVDWWSRGGDTDMDNAALLCQRHHTKVHTRDLVATVTATGVTWHL